MPIPWEMLRRIWHRMSHLVHRRLSHRRLSHRRLPHRRLPHRRLSHRRLPHRRGSMATSDNCSGAHARASILHSQRYLRHCVISPRMLVESKIEVIRRVSPWTRPGLIGRLRIQIHFKRIFPRTRSRKLFCVFKIVVGVHDAGSQLSKVTATSSPALTLPASSALGKLARSVFRQQKIKSVVILVPSWSDCCRCCYICHSI